MIDGSWPKLTVRGHRRQQPFNLAWTERPVFDVTSSTAPQQTLTGANEAPHSRSFNAVRARQEPGSAWRIEHCMRQCLGACLRHPRAFCAKSRMLVRA